ncbi:hypothetical protein [Bradyrhizobium sp.]|uniref:hypothetical protein n=1 Tax=Bradyrhizobium sp. TaxID=376 RepID=UPI0025B81699|nr:hypothetical protein [Bradyrhizobium sp.]
MTMASNILTKRPAPPVTEDRIWREFRASQIRARERYANLTADRRDDIVVTTAQVAERLLRY